MGKGVEKHPCLACGFLKVSSSGSMKCAHPDITQSESYKYGRPFTCRCTPKWCPKHPDHSYLGPAIAIPQAQRTARKLVRNGDSVKEIKESDPRDWTGDGGRE